MQLKTSMQLVEASFPYLNEACIISCDYELAICPYTTASCDIFEPRDGLGDLLGTWCIYLYSCSSSHRESVRLRRREMDRGDRCIFLDEDWVPKLAPVS